MEIPNSKNKVCLILKELVMQRNLNELGVSLKSFEFYILEKEMYAILFLKNN